MPETLPKKIRIRRIQLHLQLLSKKAGGYIFLGGLIPVSALHLSMTVFTQRSTGVSTGGKGDLPDQGGLISTKH